MQQKLCTPNTTLFMENGQDYGERALHLPSLRCPRCGEHERFHSLAALRAHLEFSHTYHPRHNLSLPTRKGYRGNLGSDRKRATAETQTRKDAGTDTRSREFLFKFDLSSHNQNADTRPKHVESPEKCRVGGKVLTSIELLSAPVHSVGQRLEGMIRTASSSMERRLLRLISELAQTDTALLCERAHSHHLAQERQEMLERKQTLSRQVNAAVMVIATLRQQLSMSEHELERREREVLAIQNFLEMAARHEKSGKVRLRQFIEGLLQRIAFAEKLLEYYQNNPHQHCCAVHPMPASAEKGLRKISKSRSTVEQPGLDEEQAHVHQSVWGASRAIGEKCRYHGWVQSRRSDGFEV